MQQHELSYEAKEAMRVESDGTTPPPTRAGTYRNQNVPVQHTVLVPGKTMNRATSRLLDKQDRMMRRRQARLR